MEKVLLPNGSVVLLKNAEKRLMICGWYPVTEDGLEFDYLSHPYPEGYIDEDSTLLFNHKEIERIDFIGFVDAEYQIFASDVAKEIKKQDFFNNEKNK